MVHPTNKNSKDLQAMDEPELVEKLRNEDPYASRMFVEQHRQQVWLLARRLSGNPSDADDITQDVFLQAFEAIHEFQQRSTLGTWLHRMTVNRFLMEQRKKKNHMTGLSENATGYVPNMQTWKYNDHAPPDSDFADEISGADTAAGESRQSEDYVSAYPDDPPGTAELQQRLEKALSKLSGTQRLAFELKYVDGLMTDEIAGVMGIAAGTVKSHLYRSLEKLRKELNVTSNFKKQ